MGKSLILGIILAFFLGGIGVCYAGDVKKGLILFFAELICSIIGCIFSLILIGIPFLIAAFVIWIYAIYKTIVMIRANPSAD